MKMIDDYLKLLNDSLSSKQEKIDNSDTTWRLFCKDEMTVLYDGHYICCGYFSKKEPPRELYYVKFTDDFFILHREGGMPASYHGKKERLYFYNGNKIPAKFKNNPQKYLIKNKIKKIL